MNDSPGYAATLSRRRFIGLGIGSLSMVLGGAALFLPHRLLEAHALSSRDWKFLLAPDREALLALIPILVGDETVSTPLVAATKFDEAIKGVDLAISLLPPMTRDALRQLFDLLSTPGGRFCLIRSASDWQHTEPAALVHGMENWREARIAVLRSAYEGLRDIVFAVWYGDGRHCSALPDFGWKGV